MVTGETPFGGSVGAAHPTLTSQGNEWKEHIMTISPNPDGRVYVAVSNNNGWAVDNDPLSAITRAVVNGGRWDEQTVAAVYSCVDGTWDVDYFGGVTNSDITKGLTVPVGFYRVGLMPDDEVEYDDDNEILPQPMVVPVTGPDAEAWRRDVWKAYADNARRADRLIAERTAANA